MRLGVQFVMFAFLISLPVFGQVQPASAQSGVCHCCWRANCPCLKDCCRDLGTQLSQAANPQQVESLCESNKDHFAQCPDETKPYCAVASCFGSGVHLIEIQQSTGPGPIGYAAALARLRVTGSQALPQVKVVSPDLFRDDTVVTKDTCGVLLYLLNDAKQVMQATAVYHSDLGSQEQAIQCVQSLCQSRGWPTSWP